jgi:uncharacterized membrane protein
MNSDYVFAAAAGIGIVAGLRSMTAPAVVSWAAHLGRLSLRGGPLAFMGSAWAQAIFSLAAIGEFVADLMPQIPSRTAAGPLIARIITGGLSGACVSASGGASPALGALLGGIGAIIGAFGGYQIRMRLVKALNVNDAFIAIPEDVIAIALACLCVFVH